MEAYERGELTYPQLTEALRKTEVVRAPSP